MWLFWGTLKISSLLFFVNGPLFAQSPTSEPHPLHEVEGKEHQHGSHPECPLPKTAMEVVRCAMEEHPQAKRAILSSEHSKLLIDVARQIPNPDLDLESIYGDTADGKSSSTDVGLLQHIEWGGKRSSRIRIAEAEITQITAGQKEVQADVVRETVKYLHRLRQLDQEKALLADTIETLQKIIAQQSSRPALTPEQQVTLSVYRMALADTKIKESEAFEEEREIEHYFHVSTGHSLAELKPVLPKAPESWPNLNESKKTDGLSPAIMKALAKRDFSAAELSAAESEGWPSLRLGPMIKMDKTGAQNDSLYGFRIMMDLPVFSLNGGGKAHARADLLKSEKLIELTCAEENHERTEQLKVYRSAVQALKAAPKISEIEKDFFRNQSLARRGLVSGPLLIEFHRQRSELIHSRNERELKAIQSLWLIHKFDGRIFSESL